MKKTDRERNEEVKRRLVLKKKDECQNVSRGLEGIFLCVMYESGKAAQNSLQSGKKVRKLNFCVFFKYAELYT